MLGIEEKEGSGNIGYDLNGVITGSITIEADGESDPIKDILDYNLETTSDIFVKYPDGREVRFIREDASVKKRLDLIEKKVRDAFNDEEIDKADGTFNRQRDVYRKAQVLADIFAIFEYDGATIGDE